MLLLLLWPAIAQAMGLKQQTLPPQASASSSFMGEPLSWSTMMAGHAIARADCDTDYPEVEAMAAVVFADAPIMLKVGCAESSFVPTAKNPHSTATGVYQILTGTWNAFHCVGSPTIAPDNIACARKIFDTQGTWPWLASKGVWGSDGK